MEELIYNGFHGTSRENARKIVGAQSFIPGEDKDNEDFLGKGVYFFKENSHAVLWNLKKAKDNGYRNVKYKDYVLHYAVLEAEIKCSKKNLLDLEDINDIVKYDKICKKFQKEFENDEEYIEAEHKERAIINYFYKKKYMDGIFVIRKIKTQKIDSLDLNVVNKLNREILCVKESKIINNINIIKDIDKDTYNNIRYISFY